MAQFVGYLPDVHEALSLIPISCVVVHAFAPRIHEAEAGGSKGHLQLHKKFKASLGYLTS